MTSAAGAMSKGEWPVIVVGGGPTGLTTANLLARYRVRVVLIERNPGTVNEPRAVSIDDESLRTIQAFGAVDSVLAEVVLGYGSEYYAPSGRCFLRVKPTAQDYGFPKRNAFRQPVLERQLAEHLRAQPEADVRFETELIDFHEEPGRIVVHVRRRDGTTEELYGACLVACDGARSLVRDRLGIQMVGSTFRERWLIVDLDRTAIPGIETSVFCNPERPCITLPGPGGTRRYEFMLHDWESEADSLAPESIARLLRRYGSDDRSPIRRTAVYTFHARVAERWSAGRVFLAGDAAHLTPPFAGQGMNSGIRDAHNLAWKLAAVVHGQLGPALLATYEQERRPHAWDMIVLATRMGRVMMPRTRLAAAAMQCTFRLLGLWPPARDYFAQMKYKPKPFFRRGFLVRDGRCRAGDRAVGRLLPQPMVETGAGRQRLDEVLGDGFSLLAVPGTPASVFHHVAPDLMGTLPLRRVAVDAGTGRGDVPGGVVIVRDRENVLGARLADLPPGCLVLRPDRYVAAFLPADRLSPSVARFRHLAESTWDPLSTAPDRFHSQHEVSHAN